MHELQRRWERRRADVGPLPRHQDQLDAELVARPVLHRPAELRPARRIWKDGEAALRPLCAGHPQAVPGRDVVVRGADVLALDGVIHERVDRRVDLVALGGAEPASPGGLGGRAEREHRDQRAAQNDGQTPGLHD